jgi:DNA-binding response OmpR family regulator
MGSHQVLVVDDSRTVRRVVERTLRAAGFDVVLAADGKEALDRAGERTPDLVLTDFVMPGMNGLRFVQSMRAVANLASVPVVLMSAKADRIGESFVAQTGALDAITKPFSPEALLAVTTNALARAEAMSMPPPPPLAEDVGAELFVQTANGAPAPLDAPADPQREAAAAQVASALAGILGTLGLGGDPTALAATLRERAESDVLLSWAADLGALVPDLRGERALEGAIEHVPLGDVLELLRHQRQTGTLEIESGEESVVVCLSNGAVDLALARPSRPEMRIGRYAVDAGLVDEEEIERLLATRAGARQLLGTHLVKLGYLRPEDLTRLLTKQTSELVYEALRWRRGRYRFSRLATRPEAAAARLGVPVSAILMEGLRRVDEWRLVEEQIRSFDDVLRPDPDAIARFDRQRLSPEERTVLDAVDGERTVRAIAQKTRMGGFEVGKVLFQLVTSRLVRR